MLTLTERDRKAIIAGHLSALRDYARKTLVQETPLGPAETPDRDSRMAALRDLWGRYGLTDHEMIAMLFRGVLKPVSKCYCPACQQRG